MKAIKYLVLIFLLPQALYAQDPIRIGDFDKIIVSPHINLVLTYGKDPSVKISASNVDEDKIIVDTDNDVLSIYLEGARYGNKYEKQERYDKNYRGKWKEDIYKDAEVTAYVTFDYLKTLQVRGDQTVVCKDRIDQHSMKVTLYGEIDLRLSSVNVDELRINLYGENEVTVESGKVDKQMIKCYGENRLNLDEIETDDIRSTLYGENTLNLRADGEIKVTAFGESDVRFRGNAYVNKGIIIGDTDIRRLSK